MSKIPQLIGFPVSPHVRSARIAFAEKNFPIDFKEVGFDHLRSDEYSRINPFQKMPALIHGATTLYETPALLVYADSVGSGASLEPVDPSARAKMWQFIGVAQSYLYPIGVMQLYFHSVLANLFGMVPDETVALSAIAPTRLHLDVIENALEDGYIAGGQLTLADLYCGAMIDYVARTREGGALLAEKSKVSEWLDDLRARESFVSTLAPVLAGSDQH